jgi:predicted dehydrogenase
MVLVIGYGSIGSRHARILKDLGQEVAVVSQQTGLAFPTFPNVELALTSHNPRLVVIANETASHYSTLVELSKTQYRGTVLVEKPLFHKVFPEPKHSFKNIIIAYNLRCHPLMLRVREELGNKKLLFLHIYTGQHLSTWRPGRNYRQIYSSSHSGGGGVLRDLSHELDYAQLLAGGWSRLKAIGGKLSSLEIDVDDSFSIIFQGPRCPLVSVSINYLDHISQRQIIVNLDDATVKADFVKGTLQINGHTELVNSDPDASYIQMHKQLLSENYQGLCNFNEAMSVLNMIRLAELSTVQATGEVP